MLESGSPLDALGPETTAPIDGDGFRVQSVYLETDAVDMKFLDEIPNEGPYAIGPVPVIPRILLTDDQPDRTPPLGPIYLSDPAIPDQPSFVIDDAKGTVLGEMAVL
jgi:hypothetical protein